MRANLQKRLEALERGVAAVRVELVPIVDVTKSAEADRRAYAAATGEEPDEPIARIEGIRPRAGGPHDVTMMEITAHSGRDDEDDAL